MIYLIYGSDTATSRAKARGIIGSLVVKKPNVTNVHYDSETFEINTLENLIVSQGLFVSKLIIEFDRLIANDETKKVLLENIERLAKSENIFIFLEEKLLKPELKIFEKYAEKIHEYSLSKEVELKQREKKKKNFPFALADAFGSREKKTLWNLYLKQKNLGSQAEEIHGVLFWQLKTMLLVIQSSNQKETGLQPFVYTKAKKFTTHYSIDELKNLSRTMISIYHNAHRGLGDLNLLLEQLILEL